MIFSLFFQMLWVWMGLIFLQLRHSSPSKQTGLFAGGQNLLWFFG